MPMRPSLVVFGFLGVVSPLAGQTPAWPPSAGHTQIPIWPGAAPHAPPVVAPETLSITRPHEHLVADRPWAYLENVSRPTLTVYAPTGQNTGAAVVVFPGGGYQILAIDLEGTEVCDWLISRGITCVLLKYRVPNAGRSWDQSCGCDRNTASSMPLEDAQRAIGLLRYHATAWHIDPHKVGVLGFSAGGHLVAAVSTHFERRVYTPIDSADLQSSRPDFAVALYPGHLYDPRRHALNATIRVTHATPPTFLLQAENDRVDDVRNALVYYAALKQAGVPAELHLYAEGGHGFGLRRTRFPITAWPSLVEAWLQSIGVTTP